MYTVQLSQAQFNQLVSLLNSLIEKVQAVVASSVIIKVAIHGVFIAFAVLIVIEALRGLWIASR